MDMLQVATKSNTHPFEGEKIFFAAQFVKAAGKDKVVVSFNGSFKDEELPKYDFHSSFFVEIIKCLNLIEILNFDTKARQK